MMTAALPRTRQAQNPSSVSTPTKAQQRMLDDLYLRRATLDHAIRSLEAYDQSVQRLAHELVGLLGTAQK